MTATLQLVLFPDCHPSSLCGDNSGGTTVPRAVALFCAFCLLNALPISAAEPPASSSPNTLLEDSLLDAPAADVTEPEHASLPEHPVLQGLTTVALQSTGLLDYLAPFLTRETGLIVQWRAVSDSRARALARDCAGGVLLTSDPDQETLLVREGYALARREIMSDGFILVGPQDDPAGTRGKDALEALQAIADQGVPFVSRGDGSGAARREASLWKKAERPVRDGKNGYVEMGQGTEAMLEVADALGGYALVDEAAFLSYQAGRDTKLAAVVAARPSLTRIWSLLPLNPACGQQPGKTPAKAAPAEEEARNRQALVDWWLSPSTQKRIAAFTREGRPVFAPVVPLTETPPDAGKTPARSGREKR